MANAHESICWITTPAWIRWMDIPSQQVWISFINIVFAAAGAVIIIVFFAEWSNTPTDQRAQAIGMLAVGCFLLALGVLGGVVQFVLVPRYWKRRPALTSVERAWANWRIACSFHIGKRKALLALREAAIAQVPRVRCVAPAHMRSSLQDSVGLPLMDPEIVQSMHLSGFRMVLAMILACSGVCLLPRAFGRSGSGFFECGAMAACMIVAMMIVWKRVGLGVTSGAVEGMRTRWTVEDSVLVFNPVGWRALGIAIVGPTALFQCRFRSTRDAEFLAIFQRWNTREARLDLPFPREHGQMRT